MIQEALPLPEPSTRYFIARPCRYWDAARNRRFRLYRIDGAVDHGGRYPGAVWDGDRKVWLDQRQFGGISGSQLARPATAAEIAETT